MGDALGPRARLERRQAGPQEDEVEAEGTETTVDRPAVRGWPTNVSKFEPPNRVVWLQVSVLPLSCHSS
jgi:hypothetical protein